MSRGPNASWTTVAQRRSLGWTIAGMLLLVTNGCVPAEDISPVGVTISWCSRTGSVVFSTLGTKSAPLSDSTLYRLDVATGHVAVLLNAAGSVDSPVISPDGRQLACRTEGAARDALLVGNGDGSGLRTIGLPRDRCYEPAAFALGGRAIVLSGVLSTPGTPFGKGADRESDFWLMPIRDGGRLRRITAGRFRETSLPAVAGDGQTITFTAKPPHREGQGMCFLYQCSLLEDGRMTKLWPVGDGIADCARHEPDHDVRFAGYTVALSGPDVSDVSLRTGKGSVLCRGVPWSYSGVYWSEDGGSALYLSTRHGPGLSLVLLDVRSCRERVVAGNEIFIDPLRWRPSGGGGDGP
jgi:hypothetical protein